MRALDEKNFLEFRVNRSGGRVRPDHIRRSCNRKLKLGGFTDRISVRRDEDDRSQRQAGISSLRYRQRVTDRMTRKPDMQARESITRRLFTDQTE